MLVPRCSDRHVRGPGRAPGAWRSKGRGGGLCCRLCPHGVSPACACMHAGSAGPSSCPPLFVPVSQTLLGCPSATARPHSGASSCVRLHACAAVAVGRPPRPGCPAARTVCICSCCSFVHLSCCSFVAALRGCVAQNVSFLLSSLFMPATQTLLGCPNVTAVPPF
jgi:hypothetical protein